MKSVIPKDMIDKILDKDLVNIANKARDGKPLTARERQMIEERRDGGHSDMVYESEIGGEHLGNIVGLTSRRVRQLAGEGVLTRLGHGKYAYPQCVRDYCDYLRHLARSDGLDNWKERKLELECENLKQKNRDNLRRLKAEVIEECWDEVLDVLAEMRIGIDRLELDKNQSEGYNELIGDALEAATGRKAARVSEPAEKAKSD